MATIVFLILGIGLAFNSALAQSVIGDTLAQAFAWIFYGIAYLLGWITMLIFSMVITMSGFQDFINNPGVITGWTIVRDICNMFFVVILLIIAFATILQSEKYSIKSLLPRVIFAAVVINFSKLICGLIIDFGQIVMLTFVNGFKASAGANLINGLRMQSWMSLDTANAKDVNEVDFWDITLALFLACILFFFTLIVTIIMLAIITIRIIILWILIVLSPFAFVGTLLPFTQSLARQWWSKFGTWVAIGPILAFFLWLSLLMMQTGISTDLDAITTEANVKSQITGKKLQGGNLSQGSSMPNMAQFAVGVALLYGAVTLTRQMGGAVGGAIGGKVFGAATGAAFALTGARAVTERAKAVSGVLQRRRAERVSRFGERAGAAITRVTEPVRAAALGAAVTPFRVLGAPLRAPRILGAMRERYRQIREGGGGKALAALSAGIKLPSEILDTRKFASSIRAARNKSRGAAYELSRNEVTKNLADFKNARFDPEQSVRLMSEAGTTEEQVAHAIYALKKGKITEENNKPLMRLLSKVENTPLGDVLADETNKKFAHARFQLDNFDQRQKLMEVHDDGDTDLTNLDPSAYKDARVVETIMEKFGSNADQMFKKVFERGGKYAESLVEGLNAVNTPEFQQSVRDRSKELTDKGPAEWTASEEKEAELLENVIKFKPQETVAKLTTKPFTVFTKETDPDMKSLGEFVKKQKVEDIEKYKVEKDSVGRQRLAGATDDQRAAVAMNVGFEKLAAIMKRGQGDVVKAVINKKIELASAGNVTQKKDLQIAIQNQTFMDSLEPEMQKEIKGAV
ncbi:MAG: hypothetical protein ACOZBH_03420 [Patescibacteria group bacterium]